MSEERRPCRCDSTRWWWCLVHHAIWAADRPICQKARWQLSLRT